MHRIRIGALVVASSLLWLGCGQAPGESASTKKLIRAENPALGIAIGAVLENFELAANEGDQLRLKRKEGEGEIWLEASRPEIGGINLVALVNESKPQYEALDEGKFHGQVELGTQFGTAYSVRGSFAKEGVGVEERRIFSLHPDGQQILTMVYSYPRGNQSRARTEEMLEFFTELESLDFQPSDQP
ncbi:MAG: hypothetical protein K0U98_16305 [Deltaproteobacteria bacterium]|nr:hypothetical protein [Deltaproteobacteria bacterium]